MYNKHRLVCLLVAIALAAGQFTAFAAQDAAGLDQAALVAHQPDDGNGAVEQEKAAAPDVNAQAGVDSAKGGENSPNADAQNNAPRETPPAQTVTADYSGIADLAAKEAEILVKDAGAVSVQYALMDNSEIVVSGGAGVYSKASGRKIAPENMYGIGSVSKVFTAAAVMKLVEEGKLELDKPVVAYLPEFKMADARYKDITVRMLLNHSSGLPGTSFSDVFLYGDSSIAFHDNFLNDLSSLRLKADPGAFSVYCNDGFALAELVIEEVSGKDYSSYIRDEFIDPLGMTSTATPLDEFDRSLLAKTYAATFPEKASPRDSVNAIGTGGIYSTAEDMCRFGRLFMDAGLLSDSSIAAMASPEYKKGLWPEAEHNVVGYGLGWDSVDMYPFDRYGITALVKGGDTLLYHAAFTVIPEYGISAAVFTSGSDSSYCQLLANSMLLQALKAKGVIEELLPDETWPNYKRQTPKADMAPYAGLYANSTLLYDISFENNGATMVIANALMPDSNMRCEYIGGGNYLYSSESGNTKQKMSFVGIGENKYVQTEALVYVKGLGSLHSMQYSMQKLPENPISAEVSAAWEKRNYKIYLLVSEKYTSQTYSAATMPMAGIVTGGKSEGYLGPNRITDNDNALSVVQLPGSAGRDVTDYEFFTADGIEYMKGATHIYMSQDGLRQLDLKGESCSIGSNGYAVWYHFDEKFNGKTLTIDMPKNAGFAMYDSNMQCFAHSPVTGRDPVKLPEGGGYIALIGRAGSKFTVMVK